MVKRDYYLILGVTRKESPKNISRAYRRLVKKYHPDIVGTKWLNRFREIVEAYDVLSDPGKRRHYNQDLAHAEERDTIPEPLFSGYPREPEPLVPEPVAPMRDFLFVSDPLDEILQRFERNFTGNRITKAERLRSLTVEIVLDPNQALHGGTLPVSVPTVRPCSFCHGTGNEWPFLCTNCRGKGMLAGEETVVLNIPSGVKNNTVYEVPLTDLGIYNLYLRVHIRIGTLW
jgi:molecular chaperone DnaJ